MNSNKARIILPKAYLGFLLLILLLFLQSAQSAVQLTSNSVQETAPAWSPAGNTIVYMRSAAASGSGVPFNLYQVQSDGTGEGALATGPGSPWGIGNTPSWLGSTGLLLTEERNTYHEYFSFNTALAPFARTLLDGNDAAFTRILETPGGAGGGWIAASRDGSTVMWRYSSNGGAGTQQVRAAPYSALTGQYSNAVGNAPLATFHSTQQRLVVPPAMTPDGSQFVIAMPSAGVDGDYTLPWDLWLHNTDGSGSPVNLTNTAASGVWSRAPDVSPDGSRIVFARNSGVAGETWDLYSMDLDGSNLLQVTNTPGVGEYDPVYSPDAGQIAYTVGGDIYVTDKVTSKVTVSATVDDHGSLNVSSRLVVPGATASFTVTPDTGYTTNSSVVGTCPSGSWNASTYMTGAVTGDCSLNFTHSIVGNTTEICSGFVGEITHRDFTNETKSCTTQYQIGVGPSVTASANSHISLTSASVGLTPPLQIEEGTVLRITTDTTAAGSLSQAHLGPLSGATINAYRLTDLTNPVEGPVPALASTNDINVAGRFGLELPGVADDEWVLVSAGGGSDIDPDDDGIVDSPPVQNNGTLYGLAKAGAWRTGSVQVTALTDMVWRFSRSLLGEVSPAELHIRLNDLARALLLQDIDGNAIIDYRDLYAFVPRNAGHKGKLNFDYQALFAFNDQGDSVISAHHAGNQILVDQLLEQLFAALALYPVADSRYQQVNVEVLLLGHGQVTGDMGGIVNDSETDATTNITNAWFSRDTAGILTLWAVPVADSRVVGWIGCDNVSTDLSQCTVGLDRGHQVIAKFGYTDTTTTAAVHVLTGATVVLEPTTMLLSILPADTALIGSLLGLQNGDFVVGPTPDSGYLRKVVSFTRLNNTTYHLTTEDAALGDVIVHGSGGFSKQVTNGDILGYVPPTAAGGAAHIAANAFQGLEGVTLIPSDDPSDTTFRLQFGTPDSSDPESQRAQNLDVTLWENADQSSKLIVQGTADTTINLDMDIGYSLFAGLEYFQFVPEVKNSLDLKFIYTGEVAAFKPKKKVATILLSSYVFFIGPVPVWVMPEISFYLGADGVMKGTLTVGIKSNREKKFGVRIGKEGGVTYINPPLKVSGWSPHAEVDVQAELKGYLETALQFEIYRATGPVIAGQAYLLLNVMQTLFNEDIVTGEGCHDGLEASFKAGIEGTVGWDQTDAFKALVGANFLPSFKYSFLKKEWMLKHWYLDGACATDPPFLDVAGADISELVDATDRKTVQQVYTLTNTGQGTLPWTVNFANDPAINVSPTGGNLVLSDFADVTVSIDTNLLDVGTYRNELKFRNKFRADELMTFAPLGSVSRFVEIKVEPPLTIAPVVTGFDDKGSGNGVIHWTFDYGSAPVNLEGYEVQTAAGTESWSFVATVTDISVQSAGVSDLPAGNRCFRVQAYRKDGIRTPYSDSFCTTIVRDSLSIDASPGSVSESGILSASVTRDGDLTNPVLVNLSSGDPAEASVPASVTIPGGAASKTFDVSGVADSVVDGDQVITLSAFLAGYETGSTTVTVTDEDGERLVLATGEYFNESDGSVFATLLREGDLTSPLTVSLASGDTSEATVPATVVIPKGATTHEFLFNIVNDAQVDGYQILSITASAAGYMDGVATFTVIDDEGPRYSYTKLDVYGENLPDTASTWYCVRADATGLVWEAKDASYGLHHHASEYTWFDGQVGDQGVKSCSFADCNCYLDGNNCNTDALVEQVNSYVNTFNGTVGRCNAADWRLPTLEELRTLIDPGLVGTQINGDYFPYVHENWWTSTDYPANPTDRWYVYFRFGAWYREHYSTYNQVLMVRDGR